MELHQLRYFLMVAETLHFNQAAELLHMAQQPLSYQIKQLEKELGYKLFERTTRAVALTPAGKVFQSEVQAGLGRIERGVDLARRYAKGQTGILNLGYASTTFYSILPFILRQFRESFPGVELVLIELVEQGSYSLELQLINEDVDVAIMPSINLNEPGLAQECILEEPLVVALPNDHPLVQHEKITLSELADESFVMYARRARRQIFDEFIAMCRQKGFSPTIVQEASTGPELVGLVAAGLGVSLVPESLNTLWADEVTFRPLVDPPMMIEVALIWKEGRQLPWLPALRRIAGEVRQRLSHL